MSAKKATKKKPAKKAATKKPAKKAAAKKPAKKAAAKKPAKKAAAKKPAKKAAAKKPTTKHINAGTADKPPPRSEGLGASPVVRELPQPPPAATITIGPAFPNFLQRHGPGIRITEIRKEVMDAYREQLPASLVEFFLQQGVSAFAGGLLWSVAPDSLSKVLAAWLGDEAEGAIPFIRTAFGDVLFWRGGMVHYLDVMYGRVNQLSDDPNLVFELSLTSDRYLDSVINRPAFNEARDRLPPPLPNQVYAFVPPAAQGGSSDPSTVEVRNLTDYLLELRQLQEQSDKA